MSSELSMEFWCRYRCFLFYQRHFLVPSPRYGASCRILESVTTSHLILYVEKLDLHLQNFICTVSVFSDPESQCLIILPKAKKRELKSLKSRREKKKSVNVIHPATPSVSTQSLKLFVFVEHTVVKDGRLGSTT